MLQLPHLTIETCQFRYEVEGKSQNVIHSGHRLLICSIIHYILSGPMGVSWTVSEDFRSEDGSIEHYKCKENISSTEECQVDYEFYLIRCY